MPALRFKTCRLLSENVWNRKLTIIQRRILKRLRNKNKRKIYSRKNLNSYIQLQTTRKLSLFYGNLPITEMHRRRKRSYIPFLLNLETRLDVILVRLHFCETIPQARQLISHRRVCVNHRMVNIIHFKVSHGDIIYFQAQTRNPIVYNSSLYSNSTYCSASPHQLTMNRKIKIIELPTHYLEVNYRTLKAVVFYGPNIGHIPHDIRLKDLNLLLWSGNERGQNV